MRKNIIITSICAVLAGVLLFIGLVVPKFSQTRAEISLIEHEATVVEIKEIDDGYLIQAEEYGPKLFLKLDAIFNKQALIELNSGEKLYFKLTKLAEDTLQDFQIEQIAVATIRTDTEEIITAKSFYDSQKLASEKILTICAVGAALLICVAVVNGVMAIRKKLNS